MGTHDGRINHGVFVVGLCTEECKDFEPNARATPTHMPQMYDAEVAKAFRQVSPRNASTIAIQHSIHEEAVVLGGSTHMARSSGKLVFNELPLAISQSVSTSHAMYNVAGLLLDDTP